VPSETVERLAYELSFDQVVRQERALDELRARTGTLLTASAVVASFLGSRAVSIGGHAWLTALGFAAFATSISAASYVLLPKRGLVFSLKGGVLLREGQAHTVAASAARSGQSGDPRVAVPSLEAAAPPLA